MKGRRCRLGDLRAIPIQLTAYFSSALLSVGLGDIY